MGYGWLYICRSPTVFDISIHWFFVKWVPYLGPPKFRRWLVDMYPHPTAQKLKRLIDLTWTTAQDIVKDKKAALEKGDVSGLSGGKDIVSMLCMFTLLSCTYDLRTFGGSESKHRCQDRRSSSGRSTHCSSQVRVIFYVWYTTCAQHAAVSVR